MLKLTLEELNNAYAEAKKLGESKQVSFVDIVISRDPLIRHNLINLYKGEENFPIASTIRFEFDTSIGIRGRWVCISEIDVVDIDR